MRISEATPHHKRRRKSVTLILDGSIASQIEDLEGEYAEAVSADANSNDPPSAPALQDELEALRAQAEESRLKFTFEAIPAIRYKELVQTHPAADDEIELASKRGLDYPAYDLLSFTPALIAEMCVEPGGNLKEWQTFCKELSDGQLMLLFATASTLQLSLEQDNPGPKSRNRSAAPAS